MHIKMDVTYSGLLFKMMFPLSRQVLSLLTPGWCRPTSGSSLEVLRPRVGHSRSISSLSLWGCPASQLIIQPVQDRPTLFSSCAKMNISSLSPDISASVYPSGPSGPFCDGGKILSVHPNPLFRCLMLLPPNTCWRAVHTIFLGLWD